MPTISDEMWAKIRTSSLYLAGVTWVTRPAWVAKLPEEEQYAWLRETLRGVLPGVSRETESRESDFDQ